MIPAGYGINQFLPTAARRDPIRNEERVRVRATFNPRGARFVMSPNGVVERKPDAAPVEMVLYKSDLPAMLEEVETDHDVVARAEKNFVLALRREVASKFAVQLAQVPENFDEWREEWRIVLQTSIASFEREFCEMTGHTPKPLLSLEVVEELPAPETEQDLQFARLAKALGAGGAQGNETEKLQAQVMALQAQVAELLKKK